MAVFNRPPGKLRIRLNKPLSRSWRTKNQRKQQHSRQQDKIRECIADGRVQTPLRVILYRRICQPGINLRGQFYVF